MEAAAEKGILFFIALCGGIFIAAGASAFLTVLGLFPRLLERTGTEKGLPLLEASLMAGLIGGNQLFLWGDRILFRPGPAAAGCLLTLAGLFSGIFTGCLVMSLAEMLKAVPILTKRVSLSEGLSFLVAAAALGKLAGSAAGFLLGI